MWTNENRGKYKRDQLRYPSDMTDEEWTLCRTAMREAFNGVMYVLSTGCQWRYILKDLPPRAAPATPAPPPRAQPTQDPYELRRRPASSPHCRRTNSRNWLRAAPRRLSR